MPLDFKPIECFDITAWEAKPQFSRYGKRLKDVYESPKGDLYYFKQSDLRYPWEFWCEIIASKLGQSLGLDIADYNTAVIQNGNDDGSDLWGCMSTLLQKENQAFIHGQEYLLEIDPGFDTKKGTSHSYQLIRKVLKMQNLDHQLDHLHEMIAFDALICNRDRHQENWAILQTTATTKPTMETPGVVKKTFVLPDEEGHKTELDYYQHSRLSPIYDNGTSLGHNLTEDGLTMHLRDEERMMRFAAGKKSQTHIRWNGKKLKHDDLIANIYHSESESMARTLKKVIESHDENVLNEILEGVDRCYDQDNEVYKLTRIRQEFIVRLLTLRHHLLQRLFNSLTTIDH